MPTTYTWKPTSDGFIFDETNYVDGTAFVPGDTLKINAGFVNAQALAGYVVGPLRTGAFIFNDTGGSDEGFTFRNINSMARPVLSRPVHSGFPAILKTCSSTTA